MNYSIVIAEDELLLQNSLVNKINESGLLFDVVGSAQTGIQAYELIEKYQPNVLITDIKMPTMSGLELIKKVRSFHPDIDCIILSGFSDFEFAKTAIHYQVSEYLLKPVDDSALYNALLQLQIKYLHKEENYNKLYLSDTHQYTTEEIAQSLQIHFISHYYEDIKLSDISKELNYSTSYLTKIFYQYYNCAPFKYIISLRMQKARKLLKYNAELSIKQVGEAIGYSDQGYFSRMFKKHVGISPIEYREQFISET